jgi:mono/diheme cytochrome c family protein
MTPRIEQGLLALVIVALASASGSVHGQSPAPADPKPSTSISAKPEPAMVRGHHGSLIAADQHGLLVVDTHEGVLLRVDLQGVVQATLRFAPGLGELVQDDKDRVYLADRAGDRVVRIAADGKQLAEAGAATLREPHGLALTPDGASLLVTSLADHALVMLDAETLTEQWRVELVAEPRPVAVSPNGRQAVVGFLSSSALAFVDLETRAVEWRSLDPRDHVIIEEHEVAPSFDEFDEFEGGKFETMRIGEARSRYRVPVETGRRYARNVARVAYIGDQAIALHQLATPQLRRIPPRTHSDSYGGGGIVQGENISPLIYQMAWIAEPGTIGSTVRSVSLLNFHLPRAIAYDSAHDRLYIAGYGNDMMLAIADASQPSAHLLARTQVDDGRSCGIDGLVVTGEGEQQTLWVHCEFTRALIRVGVDATGFTMQWTRGESLIPDSRGADVVAGAELFRRGGDARVSDSGQLACAACHPEGRADGLTWRLGTSILQVPILAGRIVDTEPYKWDGQDTSLANSLHHTIGRLGGDADALESGQLVALAAYLRSLAPPRPPTPPDAEVLARGRAAFEQAACDACHVGEAFTDRERHPLDTSLGKVDTPSLRGLGQSAPYYHDGSAVDLAALVDNRTNIHDMADTSALSAQQKADLVAYLRSL